MSRRVESEASKPYNPSRLPLATILSIRERCEAGDQAKAIAGDLGISTQSVYRWRDCAEADLPEDDYIPGTTKLRRSARRNPTFEGQPSEADPGADLGEGYEPCLPAEAGPQLSWPSDAQEAFAYWSCLPPALRGTKAKFNSRFDTTYEQLRSFEQSKTWQKLCDKLEAKLRGAEFRVYRARRSEVLAALHKEACSGRPGAVELWMKVIDNYVPRSRQELDVNERVDPRVLDVFAEIDLALKPAEVTH